MWEVRSHLEELRLDIEYPRIHGNVREYGRIHWYHCGQIVEKSGLTFREL